MEKYIKCAACPSPGQCDEDSRCWNTVVTHSYYAISKAAHDAKHGPAQQQPAPGPSGPQAPRKAPAGGSTPAGPAARPTGGLTGRVWSIADQEAAKGLTGRDLRRAVIAACEQAGLNKSTASVQFGKWLSSQT